MNAPFTINPQPAGVRRGGLSPGAAAAIAIGALIATLVFGTLCAGVILWAIPTVQATLELSGIPASLPNIDPNDWMADHVLSPVYTQALDATVADPQVIELLGEGIGPDILSPELYSRVNTGKLEKEETIEFDLAGSKGTAVVSVVAVGHGVETVRISQITVILEDGTTIDVPPPKVKEADIR